MSIYLKSINSTLDDIARIINRYNWVSSYEIFLQSINQYNGEITFENDFSIHRRRRNGIAIRLISRQKRLKEISLGLSSLSSLSSLKEPKSTETELKSIKFRKLKPPRISSVQGDQGSSMTLSKELVSDMLSDITNLVEKDNSSQINHHVNLEKEIVGLMNLGSKPLIGSSFNFRYSNNAKKISSNRQISVNRAIAARNLNIDLKGVIKSSQEALNNQIQNVVKLNNSLSSVILHPEVLGRIIANYATRFIHVPKTNTSTNIIWDEEFNLYDDPFRTNGFGSCLFDDEGSLTKTQQVIENGIHSGGLYDLQSSNWTSGGNGFRVSWYQPMLRSYQYPISRAMTNLVLVGGSGKGEQFRERSGTTLIIHRGQVNIAGKKEDPIFIIHANESEVWNNNEFTGPGGNLTLHGSITDIMKNGTLSADQYSVVDKAVPGAVYIGYMHIPPNLISIS
ncbi:MAG: metallopeptidase TldD-related protein [Candidatus Kariarchaeaceae archaeon]|jgi:predicted Zn-dependent protease